MSLIKRMNVRRVALIALVAMLIVLAAVLPTRIGAERRDRSLIPAGPWLAPGSTDGADGTQASPRVEGALALPVRGPAPAPVAPTV